MTIDYEAKKVMYKWTIDKNEIPFYWKCPICTTITKVNESDTTKTYDCSNPDCSYKLQFIT